MLLVVVGDVEPEVLRQRIAASFGSLPRGDYKSTPLPPLKFTEPSVEITSKPIQTDYVKGTFAAPSINDPDYFAMRTAITVLQSRVFQEVRVKRNLSYAPDAEISSLGASTAAISVSSVNPNEAIRVMLGEIERLKHGDVDQDTIGQMAGYFLTTYYLKEETNAAQVAELAQYELIGGGWQRSLEFLDKIRSVKSSDVQAAANKYMKNIRFVVVGNPSDVDRSVFLGK
jgi:predicted Zn-dependent peptidase